MHCKLTFPKNLIAAVKLLLSQEKDEQYRSSDHSASYASVGDQAAGSRLNTIDWALQSLELPTALTSKSNLDWLDQLIEHADELAEQYWETKTMANLEKVIDYTRKAVQAVPRDLTYRVTLLNDLGVFLAERYAAERAGVDLEEAIQVAQQAVEATPNDHEDRALFLTNLALRLGQWYLKTQLLEDLEESIRFARQAANATTMNDPARAARLMIVGNQLGNKYTMTENITDLNESIRFTTQAVEATPKTDNTSLIRRFNYLSSQMSNLYERTRSIYHLEEVINVLRQAIETMTKEHSSWAMQLDRLGCRLGNRYERTGAMNDLEEALRLGRESLSLTPTDDINWSRRLVNFCNNLDRRYKRLGAISDLDEAIENARQAIRTKPEDPGDLAAFSNNLGCYLVDRYSRTGALTDLEEAISVTRLALEGAVADSDREMLLYNLGTQLGRLYEENKSITDLEEAIQVGKQALALTDDSVSQNEDRAMYLTGLAVQIGNRHMRTRDISNLEEAIRLMEQALEATPEDHPELANRSNWMGKLLCARDPTTDYSASREEAISHFRYALKLANSPTIHRIEAGRYILENSLTRQEAFEAASEAVGLVSRLTLRSLEISDNQHILASVVGLASDAAAAALDAGKEPMVALELLEQGRGLIGAALEDVRTDVMDLHEHPKLAEQFVHLRDKLEHPTTRSSMLGQDKGAWQDQVGHRYDIGTKFDQLVIEIRKLPGYEGFLLPPKEAEVRTAAAYGPIVVINVSSYRCDALLVQQNRIQAVPLDRLTKRDIENHTRVGNTGSPQVLEWLWDTIACPILVALGFTQPPSGDDWPHMWWIPTGSLSKFPIHAAGYHSKRCHETVLDRVLSSYGSSVRSIVYTRRRHAASSVTTSGNALLVAMERTPGIPTRLPFATMEASILSDICQSMKLTPIKPARLKQTVISHLKDCTIFHFAGHGHTDAHNPSNSYLLLEDWEHDPLRVADFFRLNLRQYSPLLAYLSACGTGRIKGEGYLDESLHLISACQLAGFRHVIGTLWEVKDRFCVDMARITYETIKDGHMTDQSVCRGLHNASRQLRDRWLSELTPSHSQRHSQGVAIGCGRGSLVPKTTTNHQGHESAKLLRDADAVEDDDAPVYWVPYVHFGV